MGGAPQGKAAALSVTDLGATTSRLSGNHKSVAWRVALTNSDVGDSTIAASDGSAMWSRDARLRAAQ